RCPSTAEQYTARRRYRVPGNVLPTRRTAATTKRYSPTPFNVHHGRAPAIQHARARVLRTAYATHPERFVRKLPQPPTFPTTTWINEPEKEGTNSMTG
ncbi:hypothetical protein E3T53_13370, partial [Cryobacterium psychrophilum]